MIEKKGLNFGRLIKNTTFLKMLLKGWRVNNKESQGAYGYESGFNLGFLGFWKKRIGLANKTHPLLYSPDICSMYSETPTSGRDLDEYHAIFDIGKLQEAASLLRPVGKRKRQLQGDEEVMLYISPKKDFPCLLMNKNGAIVVAPRVEK